MNSRNELKSCFDTSRNPGCSDQDCQNTVCRLDDFCCKRQWDSSCVSKAMDNLDKCNTGFPAQDNNCFEVDPFLRSGCMDAFTAEGVPVGDDTSFVTGICFDTVCTERPECCDGPYDENCVTTALDNCEIPQPDHHCFEVGNEIPGCNQPQCSARVCDEESSCCERRWTTGCIDIARGHPDVCQPPKPNNHCEDSSLYGGCEDERCEQIVCNVDDDCCDSEEQIGEYTNDCANLASDLCQPDVLPRPDGECPVGFTCDSTSMANCSGIRETMRDTYDFGKFLSCFAFVFGHFLLKWWVTIGSSSFRLSLVSPILIFFCQSDESGVHTDSFSPLQVVSSRTRPTANKVCAQLFDPREVNSQAYKGVHPKRFLWFARLKSEIGFTIWMITCVKLIFCCRFDFR